MRGINAFNTFLLARNKFMPKMHLKLLTYSDYGPLRIAIEDHFPKKERIQEFKETGDLKYIYQDELDKNCIQHPIAYEDFKDSHSFRHYFIKHLTLLKIHVLIDSNMDLLQWLHMCFLVMI